MFGFERISDRTLVIWIAVLALAIVGLLLWTRHPSSPEDAPVVSKHVSRPAQAPRDSEVRVVGKHTCDDAYPDEAIRLRMQGKMVVTFLIQRNGSTGRASVETSSGSDLLDQAALTCVAGWRYEPAVKNGVPIEVEWKAQIVWVLPSGEE